MPDPRDTPPGPQPAAESVGRLREKVARLEAQHAAVEDRLKMGATAMDEFRRMLAEQSERANDAHVMLKTTLDADRDEGRRTFTALRREMAPKPWTMRRVIGWGLGAGMPVLGLVLGAAMWLLSLRDTTRDAVNGLDSAAKAVTAIRGDMRSMESRAAEAAGTVRALGDGQKRVEDKLDRLLLRGAPRERER